MANLVQNPYEIITDSNGDPLEDGYVFIGEPGLSPITNPLQAYWDSDLTVPATNIRTKGGYFSNSGTPGRLYSATNYSILVQDKNGRTIYTQLDSVDYFNSPSGSAISSVETIADLRGVAPTGSNTQISVGGSVTEGDGLMGPLYYWDSTSSDTDNGVSIIKPTSVSGNGRWLWVNNNAPRETVNINVTSTVTLDFLNKIFLVDTILDVVLTVPDGDFQGQLIDIANRGANDLTLVATGVSAIANVSERVSLTWLGTVWSAIFTGDVVISGNVTISGDLTGGNVFPIGYVYTQYPNKLNPNDLGLQGTWTNISDGFAGAFFRAEDTGTGPEDASAFESGEQADLVKDHDHTLLVNNSYVATTITTSGTVPVSTSIPVPTALTTLTTTGGGDENRPVNYTIRLWERTA